MSNVVPIFPTALFTWTDRVDQVNIDFANDINSVASDLISIETTLGVNPQIEKSPPVPPTGSQLIYNSVDARISDAMTNNQLPVCRLRSGKMILGNTNVGTINSYAVSYDPFNMFNGTDVTIPIGGWYYASNFQRWDWWGDGYVHQTLTLNGQTNVLTEEIIDWAFSGNLIQTNIPSNVPRWQLFGLRARVSSIFWQGPLQKGDRLSIYSENGTSNTTFGIDDAVMSVSCLRVLPSTVTSAPNII